MRILVLDIETAPILCYTWGLWNQNISIESIVEPTYMLCWAAKWVGQKKMHYRDCGHEDFLTHLWELIDSADAIITYNGKNFDMKHINREFAEAGMEPPYRPKDIDLLPTVRQQFKFPSNKMDYVAGRLIGKRKTHVPYRLWLECMNGVASAWKEMKEYNKTDVKVTEELYMFLRPWIKNHPNHGLFVDDQDNLICRACGSDHVISKGPQPATTNVRAYQRYKCVDCGANLRGRNMVKGGKKSPQVIT
jgi:hypothetical protein